MGGGGNSDLSRVFSQEEFDLIDWLNEAILTEKFTGPGREHADEKGDHDTDQEHVKEHRQGQHGLDKEGGPGKTVEVCFEGVLQE